MDTPSPRICPQCRAGTHEKRCPHDGYATVPVDLYSSDSGGDPLVGKVFDDRYRVESLIGKGGFGAVYRATQLAVDRPVALKVLLRVVAQDIEAVRRFQQEARAASRLEHQHSLRLHDFGQTEEGILYIVTELLEGETLAALLKREGCLQAERAIRIACQALEALAEAHEVGLVHRDLKPENLYLRHNRGGTDFVKVVDFGIAKCTVGDDQFSALTRSGIVMGTPAYMSPEQARAHRVDARSDIYSVGVVLYQMLCGARPFTGKTPMDVLLGHIQTPPPRLAPPAGRFVPRALVGVVHRCLEKDPDRRPQSADELRGLLEATLAACSAAPAPVRVPAPHVPPPVTVPLSFREHPGEEPRMRGATLALGSAPPAEDELPGPTIEMRARAAVSSPGSCETDRAPSSAHHFGVAVGLRRRTLAAAGVVVLLVALFVLFLVRPWHGEDAAEPAGPAGSGIAAAPPVGGAALPAQTAAQADPTAPRTRSAGRAHTAATSTTTTTAYPGTPSMTDRPGSEVAARTAPAVVERSRRHVRAAAETEARPRGAPAADPSAGPVAAEGIAATPAPTRVVLQSRPSGATVFLGWKSLGSTPLAVDVPAEGALVLDVRRPGFLTRRVRLGAGESGTREVEMKPFAKKSAGSDDYEVKIR